MLRRLNFKFCTEKRMTTYFTTSERPEAYEHIYNPMLDLMAKHYRKMYVERAVIDFKKVVLPVKRIRTLDDHVETLMKNKEVPVVIEGRDEFEDVDLVMDYFQLAAVKRRVSANVQPVYVRIGDKDIRCTLGEVIKNPSNDWPWKVSLRRYIVGRPNLLFIPISLEENYHNKSSNRGTNLNHHFYGVWVNSYNSTYPTHFTVDPRNITTARPYRLGDLVNTFPQGIVLHERYKKLIHRKIATIDRDVEEKFFFEADIQKIKDDDTQITHKPDQDDEETQLQDSVFDKGEHQSKDKKTKKERSLKKQVKKVNQELKGEMAAIFEKDKKA